MIDAQPVSLSFLDEVLFGVILLCVVMSLVVVYSRVHLARRAEATRRRLAPLRGDLLAVGAGEDATGAARLRLAADQQCGQDLDRAVIALLTKVRGAPADDLVLVLRERDGVTKALRSMTSRSSVRRARAARTIGLLRDAAFTAELVRMLDDPSAEVRIVAARAVGALGPEAGPSAAAAVLRAVRSRRSAPGVPATVAMGTLTQLGVESESAVTLGLGDADPGVRNVAAAVVGHSLFLGCTPRLAELAAHDPDRMVRVSATEALGAVGRAEDVAVIARLLAPHEPALVRRAAARALGELGGQGAVDALVSVLGDEDRSLAVTSAAALAQSDPGRDAARLVAVDGDASPAARSAVTGVLQMLDLRARERSTG